MNILFIQPTNIIGGAEISLIDQLKYLNSNHVSCFLVLKKTNKNILGKLIEEKTNTKIFYFDNLILIKKESNLSYFDRIIFFLYRIYKNGPEFISLIKLNKIVSKYKIQIIHTNTVYSRLGSLVSKSQNIPHIQHLRELTGGVGGIVDFHLQDHPERFKSICGTHDGIIANSNFCLDSNLPWYDSKNKMVMYNSVDNSFLQLSANKKKNIVGLVANVTAKWKRHDLFIDLAKIYFENYGDELEFVIFGAVPKNFNDYFNSLKNKIDSKNLNHIVKFAGMINSKEIFRNIKILVHTCATEPFGRIFIEASASAVPVLAIKGGGASEIVNDKIGFLFEKDNLSEMARKLHNLTNNEEERLKLAKSAREEAGKYNAEISFKELIPFYKAVLQNY